MGVERAAVYDTQRNQIYFLPLSLARLIDEDQNVIDLDRYRTLLDSESKIVFEEYVAYLLDNEIGFLCAENELSHFPNMNKDFLFPAHISNIIIDTNKNVIDYINDAFLHQLETLCCNYIQLRYFSNVSKFDIEQLLAFLNPTQIKAIEIVMPWYDFQNEKSVLEFIKDNRKVRNLVLTDAPYDKIVKEEDYLDGAVVFSTKSVENTLHCGIVQLEQFSLNVIHYTESLAHNTCLNRKIAIDAEGNIKNCPSMKESYGNIRDTTLEEAINKPGFKNYWNITKDEITKCKDCEFRHVCTDCRAYLEDPEDIYSAPLKCGYDPYTCEWEEWSTNPLKEKAIAYYGMEEMVKKDLK